MKKILVLLLLLPLTLVFAQKQTIEQAEYFIGADPGEGNGTPLQLDNFGDATVYINWEKLPSLSMGQHVYVRVKSSGFIDNAGKQIPGVWSLPSLMKYPTTAILKGAEAKIVRPSLSYPLLKAAWATDGKFDNVIDSVQIIINRDSLQIGDTLMIRLQGYCDLWGDWIQIPITEDTFVGIEDELKISLEDFKLFPNPANNLLNVESPLNDTRQKYYIYSITGQIAMEGFLSQDATSINVNQLSPGIYSIVIAGQRKMFVKE